MQIIIIAFLIGAVASLAFRVWALIPLTLVVFLGAAGFHLYQGLSALSVLGDALLAAVAPQLGYALGLTMAGLMLALRATREAAPGRLASRHPRSGA